MNPFEIFELMIKNLEASQKYKYIVYFYVFVCAVSVSIVISCDADFFLNLLCEIRSKCKKTCCDTHKIDSKKQIKKKVKNVLFFL